MQERPLVSIVMPIYNVQKYLQDAIISIQAQSYEHWEVIAVDDASTDDSLALLQMLAKNDSRIKVIQLSMNSGVSNARNIGIDKAKGKYVYFLDSDDAIRENALRQLVEIAEKDNLDAILFDSTVIVEDESLREWGNRLAPRHKQVHETILNGMQMYKELSKTHDHSIQLGRCFWRLEIIRDKNIQFVKDLHIMEDDLFYYEALLLMRRVKTINIAYHLYRIRNDSLSDKTKTNDRSRELQATIVEYVERYRFLAKRHQELEDELDWLYTQQSEFYKILCMEYRHWWKRGAQSFVLGKSEYNHALLRVAEDYQKRETTVKILQQLSKMEKVKIIGDENYRQMAMGIMEIDESEYEIIYDANLNVDVNKLVEKIRMAGMTILFTVLYKDLKPLLHEFALEENNDYINGLLLV